jgi:hypothetical protein
MRRGFTLLLIACCLGGLLAACYGRVLWGAEQFGYRDAVQYFYPLYWRVQAEWQAGRVPLWEPGENAGTPLLGNPSAAVLYPGKVLYAWLPYPWAARLYVVAHTIGAFLAMVALLRAWGASAVASALAGLAYAFGAPILFQYGNVIYLVGAAWAPLGVRAADRWVRQGRRLALLELAVVLAMIVLGGDPETAYLVVVVAVGYAVATSLAPGRAVRPLVVCVGAMILAAAWVLGTLELARWVPAWRVPRPGGLPPAALPWMRWVPTVVLVAWALGCALALTRPSGTLSQGERGLLALIRPGRGASAWWRAGPHPPFGHPLPRGEGFGGWRRRLLGVAVAAGLGFGLAAAQVLPALEFSAETDRASVEDPIDVYPFSLEPIRVVELVWPNVFGTHLEGNSSWLEATRPDWARDTRVWVPSLYLGGLTLVLAAGAVGFGGERPGRGGLTAVALVSLLASFGEFTGPLWWARWQPAVAAQAGAHDPPAAVANAVRHDGRLRDGDGGVYWLLATALPGFRRFRYPSKLLTFTALAVAGLAGIGWDRLARGEGRSRVTATVTAAMLLAAGLAALDTAKWAHPAIVAALRTRAAVIPATMFGPLDAEGAYAAMCGGFTHGSVVLAIALGLVFAISRGRHRGLGVLALVVMTADLALANAGLVRTVPQALLDATPTVVHVIEEAERRAGPGRGPFRVHRMPLWYPVHWERVAGADRICEFDAWERDTIAPRYGLLHGVEYTLAAGVSERDAYVEFFGGFRQGASAVTAAALGLRPGARLVVFPRRAFDMWNTRYFVLPANPNGWNDETRAYAAFVNNAERICPRADAFAGPEGPKLRRQWVETRDFQVFRNTSAYPRAWVVHDGRFFASDVHAGRAERDAALRVMLAPGSPEPRQTAWLEPESRLRLAGYLPGTLPLATETPTIAHDDPQCVEIDVVLASPGLLILADTYDPGWRLAVDGTAAPILRANRMMRAAALGAGHHHLVFRYEPRSFRVGVVVSLASAAALAAASVLGGALALIRPSGTLSQGERGC